MTRERRALFLLPHSRKVALDDFPVFESVADLTADRSRLASFVIPCWVELSCLFCNHLHNGHMAWSESAATKRQFEMIEEIDKGVRRVPEEDS